jgi:REP-associated tyrosine transposase
LRERKRIRLNAWNYDSSCYYFITINTKGFLPYLGNIQNSKMILSDIGLIAHKCWIDITNHYNSISLDEFIIMPNHLHGIIKLNYMPGNNPISNGSNMKSDGSKMKSDGSHMKSDGSYVYGSGMPDPYYNKNDDPYCKNKPQYKKIPTIIGSYKFAVSKLAHLNVDEKFGWHKSYYDHIVRNEFDLTRIQKYIISNPANWKK